MGGRKVGGGVVGWKEGGGWGGGGGCRVQKRGGNRGAIRE